MAAITRRCSRLNLRQSCLNLPGTGTCNNRGEIIIFISGVKGVATEIECLTVTSFLFFIRQDAARFEEKETRIYVEGGEK